VGLMCDRPSTNLGGLLAACRMLTSMIYMQPWATSCTGCLNRSICQPQHTIHECLTDGLHYS
jgi:hypothetical protein